MMDDESDANPHAYFAIGLFAVGRTEGNDKLDRCERL